ncbi:MAG: hypothetical protein ACLURV_06110 [Gallintestinimicrobium sp.]
MLLGKRLTIPAISVQKKWVVDPTYGGWSYSLWIWAICGQCCKDKVPWIYRVMEVDADGNDCSGGTYTVDGKTYRVAYSLDASTGKTTGSMADPPQQQQQI